jgi:hypothetical protein
MDWYKIWYHFQHHRSSRTAVPLIQHLSNPMFLELVEHLMDTPT